MSRNLILVVALDFVGYSCYFDNKNFNLIYNLSVIRTGNSFVGLYKIELNLDSIKSINTMIRKEKIYRSEESFSMLWHMHLGHISRMRM